MRTLLLLITVLLGLLKAADASPSARKLVGRWKSDTAPTGYWIIDRRADGRFAQKQFIMLDYAKSAELVIAWGRWKLKGSRYYEIIDGTTSHSLRRFSGKWRGRLVSDISAAHFAFSSSDAHDRSEQRETDQQPLSKIDIPAPRDAQRRVVVDTTKDAATAVPDWVKASLPPKA